MKPYFKITRERRAGGVAQDVCPEFKPQYCRKKTDLEIFLVHSLFKHSFKNSWIYIQHRDCCYSQRKGPFIILGGCGGELA
jgi:hypothetical protein